jgi:hypothetical protein
MYFISSGYTGLPVGMLSGMITAYLDRDLPSTVSWRRKKPEMGAALNLVRLGTFALRVSCT